MYTNIVPESMHTHASARVCLCLNVCLFGSLHSVCQLKSKAILFKIPPLEQFETNYPAHSAMVNDHISRFS